MADRACATCVWWGDHHPDAKLYDADVESDNGSRQCVRTISTGHHKQVFETRAYADDYDGWPGALHTFADFGCNQWQARERNDGQ